MLKPSSDRLDYGNLLTPPAGYKLEFAVGTTYSLDMDALTGACIALGLSESADSMLMQNPVYLLEALRQTSDKVVLFCEGGQIAMPANLNSLYILLENMVFQVSLKKQSKMRNYPSFHPKIWLLKYGNDEGQLKYRVIVLSRNLTFDRSWDISVALEGSVGGKQCDRSVPLHDFLKYLSTQVQGSDDNSKMKRRMLNAFAKEILEVSFELNNKIFTDFEFIPVGVKDESGSTYRISDYALFTDTFHEIFILSPFVSDNVLQEFNDRNRNIESPDCTLITRKSSLEKLNPQHCNKFRIYTMKDTIVEGETCLSDDMTDKKAQDIHAKVYMHRKYSSTELYLGSLNATHSAMNGNVEFMLRLTGPNRYLNADVLKKDLFGNEPEGKENPFEETPIPVASEKEADDEESILQSKIKELCRCNPHATVLAVAEGKFDLHIEFEKLVDIKGLSISPMLSNKTAIIEPEITIKNLDALQLSEFYHITAQGETAYVHRVIKIDTDNMPENRDKEVIGSIIKDKKNFIEYISFLLGDDFLLSLLENSKLQQSGFFFQKSGTLMPAIYERMLRTAAYAPERFKEIDYIMKMLSDSDAIPDDFIDLFSTFRKAVN